MTSVSKLNGLIFESRAMAELAVYGRGVSEDLIDIVHLGVDTSLFRQGSSHCAHEFFGFPRHVKIIVYAGHVDRRKGIHSLIEAAIELLSRRGRGDLAFLICGNKGDQSREFEKMYAGLGIDQLIRFGGYRTDMAEIYPSCFCGVIPSTGWDSFPRTPLEMSASGLPVIASRLQGLPEAVLDGKTGLLYTPGVAVELADCVEYLLENPEKASELGRNGRLRCEGELNINTQYDRFLSVLKKRLG